MNRNANALVLPLLAIAVLAVIASQTVGALQASGAWGGMFHAHGHGAGAAADDPFAVTAALLDHAPPPADASRLRDPFTLGAAPAAAPAAAPGKKGGAPRVPAAPPAPPRPVLTAIVWDADPRAVIRWQGRDYTVHSGALFDAFQVVAITRDQVTLSRGSETILLQRKPQGD